jgi:hypothetical protein
LGYSASASLLLRGSGSLRAGEKRLASSALQLRSLLRDPHSLVETLYKTPTKQLVKSPVTPATVDYTFDGVDAPYTGSPCVAHPPPPLPHGPDHVPPPQLRCQQVPPPREHVIRDDINGRALCRTRSFPNKPYECTSARWRRAKTVASGDCS